tara:strand:- start:94 stop:450 length:357 start_codon:yes stop_codon:yes gene_type:complete
MGYITINGAGPVCADDIALISPNQVPGAVMINYTSGNSILVPVSTIAEATAFTLAVQKALVEYQSNPEGPVVAAANAAPSGNVQFVMGEQVEPGSAVLEFARPVKQIEVMSTTSTLTP